MALISNLRLASPEGEPKVRAMIGYNLAPSKKLHCDSCPVQDSAACARLNNQQRLQLEEMGRGRIYQPGETVFHAGGDNAQCATLISGLLKIVDCDGNGVERIITLIHPAGFVGELFTPLHRYDIIALNEARICLFPRSDYERMLDNSAELTQGLLRRTLQSVEDNQQFLSLVNRRTAREKVAGLLLTLAESSGPAPCKPDHHIDMCMTRDEMAALLGITMETVSRQIGQLEKMQLIRRTGLQHIDILDWQALTDLLR
jgi:CRP/FNR family transcriptional regulator